MQDGAIKTETKVLPLVISRASLVPLHRQVENWLRSQIEAGIFPPGARLPGRRELSEMLGGINHITINKAVTTLTREGLVHSAMGRGTFVTEQTEKALRIALILPNIEYNYSRALTRGVQSLCALEPTPEEEALPLTQRVGVVLFDSRRDATQEIENIKHLDDMALDGAIVWPLAFGDMIERLVRLKGEGFPLVLLDEVPGLNFNTVSFDDYDSAYRLTNHIISKGRKRLAWIASQKAYFSAKARYEGYHDAVCDAGLNFDRKLACDLLLPTPTAPFEEALRQIVERLFAANPPDAIVCGNDEEASATIRFLQERGLSVPGDVSVTGFGGLDAPEHGQPELTTAFLDTEKLGRAAARLLIKLIGNPNFPAQQLRLPTSLLFRQSA